MNWFLYVLLGVVPGLLVGLLSLRMRRPRPHPGCVLFVKSRSCLADHWRCCRCSAELQLAEPRCGCGHSCCEQARVLALKFRGAA